ncbi:MAG: hypothetical protein H0X51_09830 [Parachlamydiaceae bacterium]|nr:hypothetical protein [Parachlamydiaceae bacterium]
MRYTAELDKTFDQLLESERDAYHSPLETFEARAERTKAQYHEHADKYISSVQHGYEVLIEELKKELSK